MKIRSLAVFCGSKDGNNSIYRKHAAELGHLLAKKRITLIYGGGNKGIMGALADAMLESNGKITGVIPKKLVEWEHQHEGINELLVVDDMHSRKKRMYELCDAAIILPGGFGTLDEFFEMITWNQLSIHDKPIYILNSENFYSHMIAHIEYLYEQGFLYENPVNRLKYLSKPAELENILTDTN